jgi:transposase
MAERNYRKYTEAFKLEALALLEQGQKRAGQIERELGITPGLLLKWRVRYQTVGKGNGQEAAKAEIRRLQRKLAEVEEEREILKKAVNIFSRTNT